MQVFPVEFPILPQGDLIPSTLDREKYVARVNTYADGPRFIPSHG